MSENVQWSTINNVNRNKNMDISGTAATTRCLQQLGSKQQQHKKGRQQQKRRQQQTRRQQQKGRKQQYGFLEQQGR